MFSSLLTLLANKAACI